MTEELAKSDQWASDRSETSGEEAQDSEYSATDPEEENIENLDKERHQDRDELGGMPEIFEVADHYIEPEGEIIIQNTGFRAGMAGIRRFGGGSSKFKYFKMLLIVLLFTGVVEIAIRSTKGLQQTELDRSLFPQMDSVKIGTGTLALDRRVQKEQIKRKGHIWKLVKPTSSAQPGLALNLKSKMEVKHYVSKRYLNMLNKKPKINLKAVKDHIQTLFAKSRWLVQLWEFGNDTLFDIKELFNHDKNDKVISLQIPKFPWVLVLALLCVCLVIRPGLGFGLGRGLGLVLYWSWSWAGHWLKYDNTNNKMVIMAAGLLANVFICEQVYKIINGIKIYIRLQQRRQIKFKRHNLTTCRHKPS